MEGLTAYGKRVGLPMAKQNFAIRFDMADTLTNERTNELTDEYQDQHRNPRVSYPCGAVEEHQIQRVRA